jgi:hypothetical protein
MRDKLDMSDEEFNDFIDAMADIYAEEIRIYGKGDPGDDFHSYQKTVA